ncbi:MAG TPA: response regulator [bacterium]|jgi:two-component system cell cycle response regulator DivK|nr:response regulator [bacterium]
MLNEPILIVDDNPLNLKLVKRLLEAEQYQPLTAKNAEETFALMERFHPRLILMDFQMPGLDGVELTRELRADPKNKDIVIVMVTSYDQKGEEDKAIAAGCDAYITKPIDTQALPGLVADFLRRKNPNHHESENKKDSL